MKEIEIRTTAIAKQLCKERRIPVAMWELVLGDAYNLVYFGDLKELARIESRIEKSKTKKRKTIPSPHQGER